MSAIITITARTITIQRMFGGRAGHRVIHGHAQRERLIPRIEALADKPGTGWAIVDAR